MRVQVAIPEPHVSKPVLDAALEAVTRLNEQMITSGEVPSFERGLRYGIKWKPEPPGDEHFDSADKVLKRKWGDCDDLAPWHAASLRSSGEDPNAEAIVRRSGPNRWHAIVRRGDGTIDDPSLRAGMGPNIAPGVFGVAGAVVPQMIAPHSSVVGAYIVRPQIALRPVFGQHQARADLPWHWGDHLVHDQQIDPSSISMTALHTAPVAQTALVGAIEDVCRLAQASGCGQDAHVDRLCAIADAIEGASFDELVEVYGDDHAEAATAVVGSLFGKLKKGLGKLARKGLNFVPGGAAANLAIDAGSSLMKHGKKRPQQQAPQSSPIIRPGAPRASQPGLAYPRSEPVATTTSSGRQIIIHVH